MHRSSSWEKKDGETSVAISALKLAPIQDVAILATGELASNKVAHASRITVCILDICDVNTDDVRKMRRTNLLPMSPTSAAECTIMDLSQDRFLVGI